ncbi:MAG: DUF975 family protein [Muribaculaceae bacterium]|nr:DUF975 family protein [Muribaculaceae bacterium]
MTKNQSFMCYAKQMLAGNWGSAALGTLIYLIIMGALSCSYVGELILYGPLTLGYVLFIIGLCGRRQPNYETLFSGFNNFVQALVAGLLYSLAVSVGMAFLVVPGIIIALGFGMTFFIMAEHPNISGVDALQMSWRMMEGHKWELFCLNFRFIGWWCLCILTLGIGFFWFYPYVVTANLNFYRNLRYAR